MGRPKVIARRVHQLNFSLTADELTSLRNRAAAAGMHLVDYGRSLLFRNCGHVVPLSQHDGAALRLARLRVAELRRIGNNLNQITRRLNHLKEPAPAELDPLLRELRVELARELADDR